MRAVDGPPIGRRFAACSVASAIAVLIAGCGSGHSANRLTAAEQSSLRARVAETRLAADGHDARKADQRLGALARQIHRLRSHDKLSLEQAQALETSVNQAEARVAVDVKLPAQSSPTPPAISPAPPATTPQPAPAVPKRPPGSHGGGDQGGGDGGGGGGD
ncbi:MAG TPA: hypothetical protein VHE14_01710 [Solirubrobacteraceae bacterium]|nr:hypothetical protein [Solirubrobacteraceae bacterium]